MVDEHLYKDILDNLGEGVYFVDTERKITYWNRGAEQISGRQSDEVIGYRCADNILAHVDEKGSQLCIKGCPLAGTMKDGVNRQVFVYMLHKDGHRVPVHVRAIPLYDQDKVIAGGVEIFTDNSLNMRMEAKVRNLEKLALLDKLTGIGNRRYADETLAAKLDELKRSNRPFGIILSDIDDFKSVNDRYGHDKGDKVLKMVARTIAGNIRAVDAVFRWGGEEFLTIVSALEVSYLLEAAERLRVLVRNSKLGVDTTMVHVTISSGVTVAGRGDSAKSLVKRADTLLYKSKSSGKNCNTTDM